MGVSWLPHAWFCLTFKRDKRFSCMVVNTNTSHPWKAGIGINRGMASHRGMSQLVLRMLTDVWKKDRISFSLSLFPSPYLFPLLPPFLLYFFLFFFLAISGVWQGKWPMCILKSVCIMKTQDKNVYKHIFCHTADSFGLNWGKRTATDTASI